MIDFINTNFINTNFINNVNVNVKNNGLNNRFVNTFKSQHTFIERIRESERILIKYPNRIPVIVDNDYNSTLLKLDKSKYLVPSNITILQFMFVLRKRFNIEKDCALFMFINGIIPASNSLMSEIYYKYKDDDQYLYIILKTESTFGSTV
jgi:GABA(A) receptor-associated protein